MDLREFNPTLVTIMGIGGWAGVWHATAMGVVADHIDPRRILQMAALPIIWSGCSLAAYIFGVATIKSSSVIFGAMFHPVPFVVNILSMCVVATTITAVAAIRKSFRTTMQAVVEELAADARETAATAAAESDEDSDEEEEAEAQEDEEEEQEAETDDEAEGDSDSSAEEEEKAQGAEAVADQAADIVPEEAALPNSPVTPEMPAAAASAVPVTPLRPLSPEMAAEPAPAVEAAPAAEPPVAAEPPAEEAIVV
jgi:hypothetical protein